MECNWETNEIDTTHQESEHKPNPTQFRGRGLASPWPDYGIKTNRKPAVQLSSRRV